MQKSRTLLLHRWPSSRDCNENYIRFELDSDYVTVSCCLLFDADEGSTASAEVTVSALDIGRSVQHLLKTENYRKKYCLKGVKHDSSLTFQCGETDVFVEFYDNHTGVIVDFPLEKLSEFKAKLSQRS